MTTLRPGIKHGVEHFPEFVKDGVARYILIVVRPAGDLRIEHLDQLGHFLRAVSLDRLSQFLGVSFDRLRTWFDLGHTSHWMPMAVSVRAIITSRVPSAVEVSAATHVRPIDP